MKRPEICKEGLENDQVRKKNYTYRWVNIGAAQTQLQNTVNILNMHVLQAVPAFSKDRISRT
jgi:hypothetical protein